MTRVTLYFEFIPNYRFYIDNVKQNFSHILSRIAPQPVSSPGQTHLNPGESAESPFEETESWPDRIIEAQQTRVFGFTEFSAL
jgi:hypothetical protein